MQTTLSRGGRVRGRRGLPSSSSRSFTLDALVVVVAIFTLFAARAEASVGDRLPEFRECVEICKKENCDPYTLAHKTPSPILHRLLFWSCPSECDYTCQHIITESRVTAGHPVVQFHGKWPFQRFLGAQEPLSVLFSAGNLWAHLEGLGKLRRHVPASYPLRRHYLGFAYAGVSAWVFSIIFHTRDCAATEQLDYFAAGASVLYGLHLAVVRVFRLDRWGRGAATAGAAAGGSWGGRARRAWTLLCALAYACHVGYLKLVKWDYGYNMAANVAVGAAQNLLWSWFSWSRYRRERRAWAAYPGLAVAWITMAMSLELFDFPPLWGAVDAHALWHLGTIGPTVLWYNFLVKDSQDDIASTERLKDAERLKD